MFRVAILTAVLAVALLSAVAPAAEALKVEDVCTPVTTTRKGATMWVPNPDGKTWDILQWYFHGYGGPTQVFIMDLGTGELKQDGIVNRRQIHIAGRALAPNGKLFIATPNWKVGMNFWVYDPADNSLKDLGILVPDLSGEKRPMAVAPDGMIYGGGSVFKDGKAGIYQLDPNTNKVTNYGSVGPSHKPNGVWGYSLAADERYVYIASGKIPWWLIAYDRETGKEEVLFETKRVGGYVGCSQRSTGPEARVVGIVGKPDAPRDYWLYQGKAIPKKPGERHPNKAFRIPGVKKPLRPDVSAALAVPDKDGMAQIWYRSVEAKIGAPTDAPKDVPLEAMGWKKFEFKVPTYPTGIHRVTQLPDGRIFGTAGAYEGNFIYDPKTDTAQHMGKIFLSHYATTVHDGIIYMSGYPSSPLYAYDPAKPWTANTHLGSLKVRSERHKDSNPRMVGRFGGKDLAGTHKMYAAVTAADGKVYFGGRWIRDGAAGGLGWYDPKTKQLEGIWRPLSNAQITHMTTTHGGRLIVLSTRRVNDVLLQKETLEQGRLIFFDVAKGEIVGHFDPIPKAYGTGYVVGVGNRVIGWTVDPANDKASSILYAVDVDATNPEGDGPVGTVTAKPAWKTTLKRRLPIHIGANQKEAHDFRVGPDGKVWTFHAGNLVCINPADGEMTIVGRMPGGRMAFSGRDIYISGRSALRRVRDVLPEKQP